MMAILKDNQSILKKFRVQTLEKWHMELYRCLAESLGMYHGTRSNVEVLKKGSHLPGMNNSTKRCRKFLMLRM